MAIYAFDGTWNEDDDLTELGGNDTNVARFLDACDLPAEEEEYVEGVGTRFSLLGKTIGGAIGAGGKVRIRQMLSQVKENFRKGDEDIDVIGFSRGAALALQFCNEISEFGLIAAGGEHKKAPPIRLLGLWDVVGAFGIPLNIGFKFQEKNPGYTLSVPANVLNCYHAMALDERREAFTVTRLNADQLSVDIEERWFRGVHSDVGGGNGNLRLSNIALNWMLEKAVEAGLPVNAAKVEQLRQEMDATAPISKNLDILPDPPRNVAPADLMHQSAIENTLEPGESASFVVGASELYSWSGVNLIEGGRYIFNFEASQRWADGEIDCGPEGWTAEEQAENFNIFEKMGIRIGEHLQRFTPANWFEVVGTIGKDDETCFRIGDGSHSDNPLTAPQAGVLYAFANDIKNRYDNNLGEVTITVRRLD
ncbi:MAG: DUF2235 domain-containing protein [Rhizobiaceae bacterium]